jgi:beta-glucosidase
VDASIEARVGELLARMTLTEKVGQLSQVVPDRVPDVEERIRAGRLGSLLSITDVRRIEHYQQVAREASRLGIPLIVGNDVIHGYRTIFPIPLAEACTWDPALLERAARVAAEEASANGTDWIFAPMVDICRDPRWGRIAEGAGEDPFLGRMLAEARVKGFQATDLASGRRVVACPKHFVAYGAAEGGRDYNTVDLSERALREVYLPPFRAAFDAGADTVMSSFNEIAGVPATINAFTLQTVLRDEWHWPGVVLSDYDAVGELISHGVAADLKEAARLSILAGVDIDMVSDAYHLHLESLVHEGAVPEQVVDAAVRRVLRLKMRLGLFERVPLDADLAAQAILRDESRALALEVGHASMVLLKNEENVLPLTPDARVAVIGPLADDRAAMLGCWAPMGHAEDVESVLDGLRTYLTRRPIVVTDALTAAVDAARAADVVVLVVGETADLTGEAHSRAHLGLPGNQQALVDAVAATQTPLVTVLMTGRPLVIPRLIEQSRALLLAWHGGIRAGRAVADLLFGVQNPSGRLTASFPRAEGQIPVYYAHKNTGRPIEGRGVTQFDEAFKSRYLDGPNTPVFPFGFGLSYSSFEYTDLKIDTPVTDVLRASAQIMNTGQRGGTEVVQLYVRDVVASVTRPVRQLKAFNRITLGPGESRAVDFEVPARELGFVGLDMQYRVEPGEFTVWIGPDSTRGLCGSFTLE